MVITAATASKQTIGRETHWNFGNPRGTLVSLDEFFGWEE